MEIEYSNNVQTWELPKCTCVLHPKIHLMLSYAKKWPWSSFLCPLHHIITTNSYFNNFVCFLYFFLYRNMVYDNRGYQDDEFVNGANTRGNAKRVPMSTLEFTRNPNKDVVRSQLTKMLSKQIYIMISTLAVSGSSRRAEKATRWLG